MASILTHTFLIQLGVVFSCQLLAVFCKHLLDIRLRKKYTNWYISIDELTKMRNEWERLLIERNMEVSTVEVAQKPDEPPPPPPEVKVTLDPRYPEVPIVIEKKRKYRYKRSS